MIMSVKYCELENEFHFPSLEGTKGWFIPLPGGDKGVGYSLPWRACPGFCSGGVGLLKKTFTFVAYNILPVAQIKDFK